MEVKKMLVIESGNPRAQAGIITVMMLLLGPTVTEFVTKLGSSPVSETLTTEESGTYSPVDDKYRILV